MRSPSPDKPNNVFLSALNFFAYRVISAKDLDISALLAFSPKFNPSATPAAIAYIFFNAPPICVPIKSFE